MEKSQPISGRKPELPPPEYSSLFGPQSQEYIPVPSYPTQPPYPTQTPYSMPMPSAYHPISQVTRDDEIPTAQPNNDPTNSPYPVANVIIVPNYTQRRRRYAMLCSLIIAILLVIWFLIRMQRISQFGRQAKIEVNNGEDKWNVDNNYYDKPQEDTQENSMNWLYYHPDNSLLDENIQESIPSAAEDNESSDDNNPFSSVGGNGADVIFDHPSSSEKPSDQEDSSRDDDTNKPTTPPKHAEETHEESVNQLSFESRLFYSGDPVHQLMSALSDIKNKYQVGGFSSNLSPSSEEPSDSEDSSRDDDAKESMHTDSKNVSSSTDEPIAGRARGKFNESATETEIYDDSSLYDDDDDDYL